MNSFSGNYLAEAREVIAHIDVASVEALATSLSAVKQRGGRLFVLGVGGSAAHASHAANDFRKQCGLEAYAPTDNVAELTARTNDDGWGSVFADWLKVSRIAAADALLILSVGGGDRDRGVSVNIVNAIDAALAAGATVTGIVGRDSGYTAKAATAVVVIPPVYAERAGQHTIGLMAVVWKAVVAHPLLSK